MRPLHWHIGLHKTATTWLQRGYFSEHPEINLLNNPGAPWNDRLVSYIVGKPDYRYSSLEADRILEQRINSKNQGRKKILVVSAERLSGHPISGHYDRIRIAKRIADINRPSKLLITLRDPVTLVPSIYRQMVKEGFSGTYKNLINMPGWKRPSFTLDAYDFNLLIKQYNKLLGENNVHILFFESLKEDALKHLNNISNLLGVTRFEPLNLNSKSNKSSSVNVPFMATLNIARPSALRPDPLINLSNILNSIPFLKRSLLKYASQYNSLFLPDNGELESLKQRFDNYEDLKRRYATQ